MRKIREVLRLKLELGLGNRQVAASCSVSHVSVGNYVARFEQAGLRWPLPPEVDDGRLSELLFGASSILRASRPLPDMLYLHRELRRKHVTLQRLWEEYRESHPDGYRYSQFCEHYHRWAKSLDVCLRQEYRGGERLFTDYAGPTLPLVDPATGEVREAHLFVAVLGASNYTYAEATLTEQLPDWIDAHVHAYEYFGGVPAITTPDNCKPAVSRACRYEPDLNPTYQDMARHYGTAVIPARPAKPRDKAKVEAGVLIAERWIMAALRHQTFFSLADLNRAVRALLEKLNHRPFKKLPGSRAELFREVDAPALLPLPSAPYEFAAWKKARVNIDYHVEVDRHYYSVPYRLVRQEVEVRLTARTVEVFHKGQRVAAHPRDSLQGKATTLAAHMPKAHQRHLAWTPGRLIRWAGTVGENCALVVQRILESKPHPEQGFRSCLGIMRLAKGYEPARVEAACRRALTLDVCSYRSLKSILETKLDTQPLLLIEPGGASLRHGNVRGQGYFA
jgi:transposase